ncbi:Uncharacterised protein [uncultured archaeon]|nr:Uncharacterised protein [uncultured archaeon]
MKRKSAMILGLLLGSMLLAAILLPNAGGQQSSNATASLRILSFDFSPKEVATDASAESIKLAIHIADDNPITAFETVFISPSKNQSVKAQINSTDPVSGREKDGNCSAEATVPRGSEEGTWGLDHLLVCNALGDCKRLDQEAAKAQGFPTELKIRELNCPANSSESETIDEYPQRSYKAEFPDPAELGGWSNTNERFSAQKKIIINSVFNHPALCGP